MCNDVKLTLFKTTSGYREQILGHRCFCWAPADENRNHSLLQSIVLNFR
ncbi:hypothetical protein [Legionella pneumophila]|nr:hypothetical protein [Legionella pneumophila]